jgi:hypothetical protein
MWWLMSLKKLVGDDNSQRTRNIRRKSALVPFYTPQIPTLPDLWSNRGYRGEKQATYHLDSGPTTWHVKRNTVIINT